MRCDMVWVSCDKVCVRCIIKHATHAILTLTLLPNPTLELRAFAHGNPAVRSWSCLRLLGFALHALEIQSGAPRGGVAQGGEAQRGVAQGGKGQGGKAQSGVAQGGDPSLPGVIPPDEIQPHLTAWGSSGRGDQMGGEKGRGIPQGDEGPTDLPLPPEFVIRHLLPSVLSSSASFRAHGTTPKPAPTANASEKLHSKPSSKPSSKLNTTAEPNPKANSSANASANPSANPSAKGNPKGNPKDKRYPKDNSSTTQGESSSADPEVSSADGSIGATLRSFLAAYISSLYVTRGRVECATFVVDLLRATRDIAPTPLPCMAVLDALAACRAPGAIDQAGVRELLGLLGHAGTSHPRWSLQRSWCAALDAIVSLADPHSLSLSIVSTFLIEVPRHLSLLSQHGAPPHHHLLLKRWVRDGIFGDGIFGDGIFAPSSGSRGPDRLTLDQPSSSWGGGGSGSADGRGGGGGADGRGKGGGGADERGGGGGADERGGGGGADGRGKGESCAFYDLVANSKEYLYYADRSGYMDGGGGEAHPQPGTPCPSDLEAAGEC